MTTENEVPDKSYRKHLPLIIIAIVAGLGALFLGDVLSFDVLRDNREALIEWRDQNYLVSVFAFLAIYTIVVAFSLPGAAIMTLSGGFLFSVFPGALYAISGATLGAIAIFLAAKTGLGDSLHAKMSSSEGKNSFLRKMEAGIRENEISYLFIMRLVPVIPFFVANLAPAFFGVSLRNFALTTFFGIMPGSVVFTSVGAGLGTVFEEGGTPNFDLIFEPYILGPILGLCVLALLPIVIKKFKSKGQEL